MGETERRRSERDVDGRERERNRQADQLKTSKGRDWIFRNLFLYFVYGKFEKLCE